MTQQLISLLRYMAYIMDTNDEERAKVSVHLEHYGVRKLMI